VFVVGGGGGGGGGGGRAPPPTYEEFIFRLGLFRSSLKER